MSQGILIAIEGTDGSGKATQTKLLQERLTKEGYEVAAFTFPRYDKESSYFVKQYLNGQYGSLDQINPYTGTLFYALDRYAAAAEIKQALAAGKVVLTDRYTGSNMAHQGAKFPNAEERRGYFIWNDNLEFTLLGIPRPTVSFVLRVPADIAQGLVDHKAERDYTTAKRDIHEADLQHLQKSVEVYDDLCSLFPADFKRIDCVRSNQLLSIDEVQTLLWNKVAALLPEPAVVETPTEQAETPKKATKTLSAIAALRLLENTTSVDVTSSMTGKQDFFTPPQLLPATKKQYQETMTSLLQMYDELHERATTYAASHDISPESAANITSNCFPAAVLLTADTGIQKSYEIEPASTTDHAIQKQVDSLLPAFYTGHTSNITLQTVNPRNELDMAATLAYQQSDLPLAAIGAEAGAWTYDQKASLIEAALKANLPLDSTYSFDATISLKTLLVLAQSRHITSYSWQSLTPRNGYDVPEFIDDAGLTDLYERCFDTSLELHSILQAEGYIAESQYATLLGHKVRCLIQFSAAELTQLIATANNESKTLTATLIAMISERHPIIGSYLQNSYRHE